MVNFLYPSSQVVKLGLASSSKSCITGILFLTGMPVLAFSHKTLQLNYFFHFISDNDGVIIFCFLSCAFGLQIFYLCITSF